MPCLTCPNGRTITWCAEREVGGSGHELAQRLVDWAEREHLSFDRADLVSRTVLEAMLDPVLCIRPLRGESGSVVDFTYAEANRAACEYMRMPPDQLIGARLRDLLPGVAASGMLASYIRAVETGEPLILNDEEYDHEILDDRRYFDVRAIKVGDGLSFTWRDVTDRDAFELRLNALAKPDPLTGLVNRTELVDRIVHAAEVARAAGMSIAEALVDLDHFKDINDTLGHEGGDDLPKSVARRIEGAVKRGDVVARIGGDEFDALMARGFSIAIDDFGVGFASLAYLCDFRCQQIKIDRSFLCAPGDLSRSRRLIRALVARAVELDIGVTAEGVETTEQAAFLRGIGCHSGQGYLFAPAVPIPSLAPMLARGFARSDGWSDV